MKTGRRMAALALCAALSLMAPYARAQQSQMSKGDAAGMQRLAQANLAEIESGKLAASKAQSEEVKAFAKRMIDDHGKMLKDLQKIAESKGVKLPDAPGVKERAEMKILERTSGERFDRRYMADMVEDHKKDWKDADSVHSGAKDPDLREAANDAKGVIKQHLELAQQIARSLGASRPPSKNPPPK